MTYPKVSCISTTVGTRITFLRRRGRRGQTTTSRSVQVDCWSRTTTTAIVNSKVTSTPQRRTRCRNHHVRKVAWAFHVLGNCACGVRFPRWGRFGAHESSSTSTKTKCTLVNKDSFLLCVQEWAAKARNESTEDVVKGSLISIGNLLFRLAVFSAF